MVEVLQWWCVAVVECCCGGSVAEVECLIGSTERAFSVKSTGLALLAASVIHF